MCVNYDLSKLRQLILLLQNGLLRFFKLSSNQSKHKNYHNPIPIPIPIPHSYPPQSSNTPSPKDDDAKSLKYVFTED